MTPEKKERQICWRNKKGDGKKKKIKKTSLKESKRIIK